MESGNFSQKEALSVIENMVDQSRYKLEKEAKYFLLWGWMVFAASILQFVMIQMDLSQDWLVWPVFMSIALLLYLWMVIRSGRENTASTYIDRINKYLWIGIAGPILITLLIGLQHSWPTAYPFFMAIYGWGALVSGGIIRFRPLVLGGVVSILSGIISVFVSGSYILLLLAFAILAGFIIPGHFLRNLRK